MLSAVCLRCGTEFEPGSLCGTGQNLCQRCVVTILTKEEVGATDRSTNSRLVEVAPLNYYLVCDHRDIIGRWENDGRGWMIRIRDGFVRVAHVADELPWFGDYVLIEIGVQRRPKTVISHIRGFQLREAFALTELVKSDNAVLRAIVRETSLTPAHKECVRAFVKSRYLRCVWERINDLFD